MTDLTTLATDWGQWLLLRRVNQGEVTIRDGGYVLGEQPVTGYLAAVLDALLEGGWLVLGEPDSRGGQRLRVTDTGQARDRKSTRLNSSHANISYAVFCLKKKKLNI